METENPREALDAKDVTTRAAAARDIGRIGEWADLPKLVKMATEDKSSAVRLYTAAAVGDILARHRGAAGQTGLDASQREQVHAWFKGIDPGTNPAVLLWLAGVADASALDRLGRMLRDPRNEVRAGATVALRRLALSGAAASDPAVEKSVGAWLNLPKVPPDASLELIRLVGEAGWASLAEGVRQAASAGRPHAAAADEALKRLQLRDDPATWEGFWVDEGLDVLEIATPRKRRFEVRTAEAPRAGRLIWAPKVGIAEQRFLGLQAGGATLWKQEGKDLVQAVEDWYDDLPADAAVLGALSAWVEPVEGPNATRARALLALKAGDPARAAAWLEELAGHKKPRADVFWWWGRALADLGKKKQAVAALDQFLEKVPKKGEYRKEAEALRHKLG
jgi:tetratricopeptide (TPR) repeat protein